MPQWAIVLGNTCWSCDDHVTYHHHLSAAACKLSISSACLQLINHRRLCSLALRAAQPHTSLLLTTQRISLGNTCTTHLCSSYLGPRSWKLFVGGCGTGVSGCDATLGAVSTGSCGAEDHESAAAACGRCLRPPHSACNYRQRYMGPDAQDDRAGRRFDGCRPWQEDCDEIQAS